MELEAINERLDKITDATPLEQDEEIKKLAEETGKKEIRLREQLKVLEKERKDKIKTITIQAGSPLTERQFYVLQMNASKDNEKLQQYLEEGLEFINNNDIVRGFIKAHLNKIMEGKQGDLSLKFKVVSHLQKKEFAEASELLVQEIKENNYIFTTETDKQPEMYIYDSGIYVPEGESKIKAQIRKVMEDHYSEWLANQVLAKIRTDTGIDPDSFFKEKNLWEVPVLNGILDLKEIELKEFHPSKIFFAKLPVKYDIEATCPMIDKFLTDVLAHSEDKDVFYELAGFGLVKDYFLEKAFMFVGNGRNGKGKSIELLKRLVGVYNTASVPLSAITSESPFVERLWKRYFNLAGDISSKDLKETGMFKSLTGRDPISANRKYKNVVEFTNYAKMVFACNELPRVYDYSDGFWDRWVLMEFPYKFVDQEAYDNAKPEERVNWKIKDPQIINKIATPEEMSGFLNMALAGLHRAIENRKFSYTKGTVEVKNRWIRKADSFMAFCMDCVEDDYDSKITKKELRKIYKDYCAEHKVNGVSDKAIKATLQELFGVSEEYDKVNEFINKQEWCWSGIKFKKGVNKGY